MYKQVFSIKPESVPPERTLKQCVQCEAWFHMPRCHAHMHKCCSAKCVAARRMAALKKRERECKACGSRFTPRPRQLREGHGKFCSHKCSAAVNRPDLYLPHKRGKEHPRYRGGTKTWFERCAEDPKLKDRINARRRELYDPLRNKDYEQTRRRRKYGCGRLPNGTITRLFAAQKGRCANCRIAVGKSFHVDHIFALAKGGKHEPHNLQILCGPCNQRKFTADPLVFAKREGRLL